MAAALEQFPGTQPILTDGENEKTDVWACERASRAFAEFSCARGLRATLIHAQNSPRPFVGDHWWVCLAVGGRDLNIDWTARQFHNLEHPALPEHQHLPCPLMWFSNTDLAGYHPIAGAFHTVLHQAPDAELA